MIIVNKTSPARPLVLSKPSPATVTGFIQYDPVVLKPGSNEIDEVTAKQLETSATVKEWLKRGWIAASKPSKGKEGSAGVAGFDTEQAVSLVNECFDIAALAKWKEQDSREPVRVAIVERVAQLKAVAKED